MPSLPTIHPSARRNAVHRSVSLLVWHDFVRKDKLVWFDTTVSEFQLQLARLKRAGAQPITLDQLYAYLKNGAPLPPAGACVFCFDDNTVGIHDFAVPLLAKWGWPCAISAHTAYIGKKTSKGHNTFAQLQAMERQGATIVSQTHMHPPDLRTLADSALQNEFIESKERMEAGLGHSVRDVTYPSGKWDMRVAEAAAMAGYRMGLTEDFGPAETSPHLLSIHRYSTHRRFEEALRAISHSRQAR